MSSKLNVLMIGPSRDSQGGIAGVVNGYYEAGLDELCNLTYLNCVCPGNRSKKLACGIRSLLWTHNHACDFDVAHIHMGGGNSFYRERLFAQNCLDAGVPTVLHLHDGLFKLFWEKRASKSTQQQVSKIFESVSALIVLSVEIKEFILENVSRNINVVYLPNGIEVPEVAMKPKERGSILFFGHFDDNKNADILVRSMAAVRDRFPEAVAYFCADGDIQKHNNLVDNLGLSECCVHLGWLSQGEKQRILDATSIFCLPSKNEAMPVGLLEAMANELAAIVTPVGGMLDIVDDETGVFVPVGDVDALSEAICGLISDEDRRSAIASAGREKIRNNFAHKNIVSGCLELYEYLVSRKVVWYSEREFYD